MTDTKRLYRIREVAAILSVSHMTIRREIADGKIDHIKIRGIRLISEDQLNAYLKKNRHRSKRRKPF